MKIARLFSGFDGAGEGIRAAGYELSWAIEKDDRIADVARMNGYQVLTADVLTIDPSDLERPDGIHASPPCTNASQANSSAEINADGSKETQLDRDLATKTIQFVETLRPHLFTLENVWQYRLFQSFAGGDKCEGIYPALVRLGYKIGYWHVNAADYGVPQTRKRLILVASLDFVPQKPWETHYNPTRPELAAPSLFGSARSPWVGWYSAIKDLIPTLPESQFAPWQLERLPDDLRGSLLVGGGNTNLADAKTARRYDLVGEPAPTVMSSGAPGKVKAFIIHPTDMRTMPVIDQDDPMFTVMSTKGNGNMPRAFLAAGGNGTNNNCARLADEPAWTVASVNRVGNIPRAWLSQGRVVKMTPRALARFQSFADTYRLSGNNSLDCKGIGNACPPLLFRKLYESFRGNYAQKHQH